MKAYHFSELPMLMGTHEIERGPSTDFQRQLSATMQDMWVDFARDPERGLQKQWGWTAVGRENCSAMVLGKDGVLFQQGGMGNSLGTREIPLVGKEKEQQSG
jgi:carboxylesterase type B